MFYDQTNIRLVEERTELQSKNPKFVTISSTSAGTLSKVNPSLLLRKNQQLKFDVSDSSLSFTDDGITYSAFKLQFFKDKEYLDEFITTQRMMLMKFNLQEEWVLIQMLLLQYP